MAYQKSASNINIGYDSVDYTSTSKRQEAACAAAYNDGSFVNSQALLDQNAKKGISSVNMVVVVVIFHAFLPWPTT